MTPGELDHILAQDGSDAPPSAAFAQRVMAAVHREAALPPPPRFPWGRFGLGVTASGVMAAAATALLTQFPLPAVPLWKTAGPPLAAIAPACTYAAAALVIGLAAAAIPRVRRLTE